MKHRLNKKVAIITGANQGFGLALAQEYIEQGASIAICARDGSLLEKVQIQLTKRIGEDQKILALSTDVSNPDEVHAFVDQVIKKLGKIDILVNNAGVYGPMGVIEDVEWEKWVQAIEINLFGSILMCRAVLPHFKAQRAGKIIQLSGGGATNPMPCISAYAVSKAGIVRFVETLAEEVKAFGIDVNAIAPGALNTRLLEEVLQAGPEKVGDGFHQKSLQQKESGGVSLEIGVSLAVFLGSSASDGVTGKLISALWDNWHDWPNYLEALDKSDVYTLRRITGRDRGMDWGDK